MSASYAVTMNGRISTELKPRVGQSIQDELRARLDLLDGSTRFALWLWRLPVGLPFDRVDLESWPMELIQCAGGIDGRFTCEIRYLDADGNPQHEVIGRSGAHGASNVCSEPVRWAENSTDVRENEILDLDSVSELFATYLVSGGLATGYETRPVVQR